MHDEQSDDRSARVDELQAHVRERLGMDVQAIGRARVAGQVDGAPVVWEVMTAAGSFWLVERGDVMELFLATTVGGRWRASTHCPSAREAVRRFLELHPAP